MGVQQEGKCLRVGHWVGGQEEGAKNEQNTRVGLCSKRCLLLIIEESITFCV